MSPSNSASIAEVYSIIQQKVLKTPVLTSAGISELASRSLQDQCGSDGTTASSLIKLFFKCENFQESGLFKLRGATHCLAKMADEDLKRGIVTYSSGNHANGILHAARVLSQEKAFPIPVHVILPTATAVSKVAMLRENGAEIHFSGNLLDERKAEATKVQKSSSAVMIPPSEHPDIHLGQGTALFEFMAQVEELDGASLDAVIVPCGGGGLLSGTAVASAGTAVRVFGSEPQEGGADDVSRGLKEGRHIQYVNSSTIADGLRSPVSQLHWNIISKAKNVVGVYSVTEQQIRDAVRLIMEEMKLFVEPSSAVPLAALLFNDELKSQFHAPGKTQRVGIILTGSNMSVGEILSICGQPGALGTGSMDEC